VNDYQAMVDIFDKMTKGLPPNTDALLNLGANILLLGSDVQKFLKQDLGALIDNKFGPWIPVAGPKLSKAELDFPLLFPNARKPRPIPKKKKNYPFTLLTFSSADLDKEV